MATHIELTKYLHTQNFSRLAIFIVYFWFGVLKLVGLSPASDLVSALHARTVAFIDLNTFLIMFGVWEIVIGILFIVPQFTRVAKVLFALHISTTLLPFILLPGMIWSGVLVPTLEGQYIIKNILLIALVLNIRGQKDDTSVSLASVL